MAELSVSDIDYPGKQVHVKGKRARSIPLTAQCIDALTAWSKERIDCHTDKLFITTKGEVNPLSERSIDHIVRKWGQQAQLSQSVNAHTLRNTYATHLLQEKSLKEAAKLLGISDHDALRRFKSTDPQEAAPGIPDTRSFLEKTTASIFKDSPKQAKVLGPLGPLQVPESFLVGRTGFLEEIRSSIHRGEPVLLTGPLGIGKTHLMHHVAKSYAHALYVASPSPTKPFLEELATAIQEDWRTALGKRVSTSELEEWILGTDPMSWPLLFLDDLHELKVSESDFMLALLDKGLSFVSASDKPLDKVQTLKWRLKELELTPISQDASEDLIDTLTANFPTTDRTMMKTRILGLANGHPGAIVELCRQLSYEHVVTPDAIRDIYHDAGIRYRDWTSALVVFWALIVCARFVALGLHSFEGYILAGLGTSLFMVFRYFLMRMR